MVAVSTIWTYDDGMSSEDVIDLWAALMGAHQAVSGKLAGVLEDEHDLSLAGYEVIARLANAPDERLRMQDLAAQILISKSGLTRLCDRLEHAGLIARAACPSDRRGTFAVLTPEGKRRYRRAAPAFSEAVQERFAAHLSAAERKVLRAALRRLAHSS